MVTIERLKREVLRILGEQVYDSIKNNLKYLEIFHLIRSQRGSRVTKEYKKTKPKTSSSQDISHEFFEEEVKSLKSFAWIEQEI